MELRQLRYFLAVVDAAHFTRAADHLYVSQPALSQQIRQLEQELGVTLLDRAGKKVRPTAAGTLFTHHARRILQEVEQAQVALLELEGLQRGEITIGVVQTVNAYAIPTLVAKFVGQYPAVTLRIQEHAADDIEQKVVAGDLQMGISFIPTTFPDLDVAPLFTETLVFVSAGQPSANEVTWSTIAQQPLVLLPTTFCTRRLIDNGAQAANVSLRPVIEMNTIASILGAVRRMGVATILPALALATEEWSDLKGVPIINPVPERTVGLVWRRGGYLDAATRAFRDICRSFW